MSVKPKENGKQMETKQAKSAGEFNANEAMCHPERVRWHAYPDVRFTLCEGLSESGKFAVLYHNGPIREAIKPIDLCMVDRDSADGSLFDYRVAEEHPELVRWKGFPEMIFSKVNAAQLGDNGEIFVHLISTSESKRSRMHSFIRIEDLYMDRSAPVPAEEQLFPFDFDTAAKSPHLVRVKNQSGFRCQNVERDPNDPAAYRLNIGGKLFTIFREEELALVAPELTVSDQVLGDIMKLVDEGKLGKAEGLLAEQVNKTEGYQAEDITKGLTNKTAIWLENNLKYLESVWEQDAMAKVMKALSGPGPVKWHPGNGVVQDHQDGTVYTELTNFCRSKLGLPHLGISYIQKLANDARERVSKMSAEERAELERKGRAALQGETKESELQFIKEPEQKPHSKPPVSVMTADYQEYVVNLLKQRLPLWFPDMVQAELNKARKEHGKPMNSMHEGISVIREEFEEVWAEVKRKDRNIGNLLTELVQLAAVTQRMVEDVVFNAYAKAQKEVEENNRKAQLHLSAQKCDCAEAYYLKDPSAF